jgi:hypothetical protein
LLKQWFAYIEKVKTIPNSLQTLEVLDKQIHGNEIRIQRWIDLSPNLLDILTYESILTNRGWVIQEERSSLAPDQTRVLPLGDNVQSA